MPGNMNRWENCGAYDQETGLFYLREGEHEPIHSHFKLLRLNRLHQKKDKQENQKSMRPEPTYMPKVSKTSAAIVDRKRKINHFGNG